MGRVFVVRSRRTLQSSVLRGGVFVEVAVHIIACAAAARQKAHLKPEHTRAFLVDNRRTFPTSDRGGSVLRWRRCDTLCTSGFMNGVMFGQEQTTACAQTLYALRVLRKHGLCDE